MEDLFEKVKDLFGKCFAHYYSTSCQCAFPRYHQLVSIDCTNTGDSYSCYETEMLIFLSKPYFDMKSKSPGNDNAHQEWTCKKCGSVYSFDWDDFSIHVNRQTLHVTDLKIALSGKEAIKPIPLCLGLSGHSFPPQSEMAPVSYEEFEKYMLEM